MSESTSILNIFNYQIFLFIRVKHDGVFKAFESIGFFRNDIQPIWEDPENKKGGTYTIKIDGMESEDINKFWENFVYDIIGEITPSAERVNMIIFIET